MPLAEYQEVLIDDEIESLKRKQKLAENVVQKFSGKVEVFARKQIQSADGEIDFNKLRGFIQKASATLENVIILLSKMTPDEAGYIQSSDVIPILAIEPASPSIHVSTPTTPLVVKTAPWSLGASPASEFVPPVVAHKNEPKNEVTPSGPSSIYSSNESKSDTPSKNNGCRFKDIRSKVPASKDLQSNEFDLVAPDTNLNVDAPEFKPMDPSLTLGASTILADKPAQQNFTEPRKRVSLLPSDLIPESLNSMGKNTIKAKSSAIPIVSPSQPSAKAGGDRLEPTSRTTSTNGDSSVTDVYNSTSARSRSSSHSVTNSSDTDHLLKRTAERLNDGVLPTILQDETVQTEPNKTQTEEKTADVDEPYEMMREIEDDTPIDWNEKIVPAKLPRNYLKARIPPLWKYVHVTCSREYVDGILYVQLMQDENLIHSVVEDVNKIIPGEEQRELSLDDIDVDIILSAPFEGSRYRALITKIVSVNEVHVLFVDYGNSEIVSVRDLRVLSGRNSTRICKMAVPCELAPPIDVGTVQNTIPEEMYMCFGHSRTVNKEVVYTIVDIMAYGSENLLDLPATTPLPSPGEEYGIVITFAQNPRELWAVSSTYLHLISAVKLMIQNLPPCACSESLVKESTIIAYKDQRAIVQEVSGPNHELTLFLLDKGEILSKIPISECRRLPLATLRIPPLARPFILLNCSPKGGASTWSPDAISQGRKVLVGRKCIFECKQEGSNVVALIDAQTRKYIARELRTLNICD